MKQSPTVPRCILVLASLLFAPGWLYAQGTAFTYQGQLFDGTNSANGNYALSFTLYPTSNSVTVLAGPITNAPVAVSNGLFTVLLDFGSNQFTGPPRWLQIYAATNSAMPNLLPIAPRQLLSPAPYAIFANTASNLSGTLPTAQLSGTVANNQLASNTITVNPGAGLSGGGTIPLGGSASLSIPASAVVNTMLANPSLTVTAGTGLGGGGTVALGSSTTLSNTGVLSVTGNADITASPANGNVILGDTATSANTASTMVKRDGTGSFSAGSVTLSGNLNLPATTATAGIINSGGSTLLHAYGNSNFFGGTGAGNLTMSGGFNSGIGAGALSHNTTGSNNVANGFQALYANANGSFNTANGYQALFSDNGDGFTGDENTATGAQALYNNSIGSNNVANGFQALFYNSTGTGNTADGFQALFNSRSSGSVAIGYQALYNNDRAGNVAIGYQALYANFGGLDNTANGYQALYANTAGSDNTANGTWALFNNTTGNENTANGSQALYTNTTGSDNTANGYGALYANTTGSSNTANGSGALNRNATGSNNVANGVAALYANTTGAQNTADGTGALINCISGSNNIALGYQAGSGFTAGESGNIDIGNTGVPGESNVIRIGSGQTTTVIAGIFGSSISGSTVAVNANGQLGVANGSQATNFWQTTGNFGTTPGANYLGTADNEPLAIRAAGGVQITAVGGVNLDPSTSISFGSQTRQMLNLYGTDYAIGVQTNREYFRCGHYGNPNAGFAWFLGGVHNDAQDNPGSGGVEMMALTFGTVTYGGTGGMGGQSSGSILTVNGEISAQDDVYGYTFQSFSDRNKKTNFLPVNSQTILDKVAALPITSWNFTNNSPKVRHIGPMAQDFHAAFGLDGADDKHIAVVDEGGVALSAIQGLNQKVDAENAALRAENAELKQRLEKLERLMESPSTQR